jgi:hypothetical protein
MVHPIEALHHAARQYCIERASIWHERYSELRAAGLATVPTTGGTGTYTRAAFEIFPRYQTLAAIKNEVERFLPDNFNSLEEARSMLALAGETAQSLFTEQRDATAIAADADERRQFAAFIRGIDEPRLSQQQRLPYRRVLGTAEQKKLHNAVTEKWGRWYGGCSEETWANSQVVTLHDAAMAHPDSYPRLRAILSEHGVAHVLELREYGDGYEIPIESAGFTYNGAEGFWTSDDLDWLVYASHESSITFGSQWLVKKMRAALPEFERYIYKGWDLAAYA